MQVSYGFVVHIDPAIVVGIVALECFGDCLDRHACVDKIVKIDISTALFVFKTTLCLSDVIQIRSSINSWLVGSIEWRRFKLNIG